MRIKADLTLLLISFIWGTAFVAQDIAGKAGSVYLFNGIRFLLAALVVLPLALRARGAASDAPPLKNERLWMAAAGLVLFAAAAFQQVGLLYTTAGHAGFITSLYVVFVPVFLLLFWKERPHWLVAAAVILAAAGAFLLSSGGTSLRLQPGDGLELIGAFLWTLHVILLGKVASRYEPFGFSVGQFVICGLLNLGLGLVIEDPARQNWQTLLGPILYTALLSVGMGYSLQVWAQRFTPPADAALILSLESVFAALAGWLVLSQTLTPLQIGGCAMIFAAVLLSQVRPRVYV